MNKIVKAAVYWLDRFFMLGDGYETPEEHFQNTLDLTERLKQYAHESMCPCCRQKNRLKIASYEVGGEGWEFHTYCVNCNSKGVVNDSGFHVDLNIPKRKNR